MVTVGPVQLYLVIASLVVLIAVVAIIFTLAFKMGFKYGVDYVKSKNRRYDEIKRHKPVSQYYRYDMRDTGAGSVRVRKPVY